jgi:viroplasmin and RNaseH domain-containing protein
MTTGCQIKKQDKLHCITLQVVEFKHKRNAEYQFWTHENHAEHIFSNKFMVQKLAYIHNNPVRTGIVEKP